jgi:hypothetical protein
VRGTQQPSTTKDAFDSISESLLPKAVSGTDFSSVASVGDSSFSVSNSGTMIDMPARSTSMEFVFSISS